MKQNILNPAYRLVSPGTGTPAETEGGLCLTGFTMRWALFGILMWWISSGLGWSHAVTWLLGLAIGFAMARKELDV